MSKSPFQGVDIGNPIMVQRAADRALLDKIRRAIFDEVRAIARTPWGSSAFKSANDCRRVLRVEVAYPLEGNVKSAIYENTGPIFERPEHFGPPELDGVALYTVRSLPAPGWRVVNPFEAGR